MDPGATRYSDPQSGGFIPTGEQTRKVVGIANYSPVRAKGKILLPMTKLHDAAYQRNVSLCLSNSFISISEFADVGYMTMFQLGGEGVDVYNKDDVEFDISGMLCSERGNTKVECGISLSLLACTGMIKIT